MTTASTISSIANDVAEAGTLLSALEPASPITAVIGKVLSVVSTIGGAVSQLGDAHATLASDVSTVANTVNSVASAVGNENSGLTAKVNAVASKVETVVGTGEAVGAAAAPGFMSEIESAVHTRLATLEAAFEKFFPSVLATTAPAAPVAAEPETETKPAA
jgi:phage-related protein